MSTTSAIPKLQPPQPAIKWDHTADQIKTRMDEEIDIKRKLLDSIAALKPEDCNFKTVFEAIAHGVNRVNDLTSPLSFYAHVAPSEDVQKASIAAEEKLEAFGVESEMRVDVYQSVLAAEKNTDLSTLTPEQKRLVEKLVKDGRRAGLGLPEEKRDQLKALKEKLSKLCLDFSNNCNQDKSYIDFTAEQLKGVQQNTLDTFKKLDSGLYRLTFKVPDMLPLLQYAENPETRKAYQQAMDDRLKINAPILDQVLDLRRQIAALLGYDTWASYVLEERMIKTAAAARSFLDDLQKKLHPLGEKDRKILLELKKSEHERLNIPFDNQLNVWDWRYLDRLYVEKKMALDSELVKEHFPVDFVIPAVLGIYKELLNVRIEEVENAVVWHPDVKQYAAWDNDAKDSSGFLGYLHLDLFPRERKYGHAAVWPLIPSYVQDGKQNYPVVCMVANLAKPTADRPGLMSHDNVVTFFHEMGHAWHGLMSRTQYSRFHGTSVARDFVEAPSQMLENWCYEKEVLRRISSHYKTQEPLSDDLIQAIINSRYTNVGLYYLRQVYLGIFDQEIHTSKESIDTIRLYNTLRKDVSLVEGPEPSDWKPGFGSFGHLCGGYDSQYYGYAYSLVFAYDMYQTVFKANPLDPAAGKRYRESILKPGSSRDEMDSLIEFLGRKPNAEAFTQEMFGTYE